MGLVLKNGVTVGAANMSTVIGGVVVTGIRKVDYSYSQKKENIMGYQKQPVGRGRGQYEYGDLTIEILKEEWNSIVSAAPNRDPMQIAPFNIPIVYDNGLPTETLNNVEFTDMTAGSSGGDTALWRTVKCVWAGLTQ